MDVKGQVEGRNVVAGIAAMIIMMLIASLLVTEIYQATEVTENIQGSGGATDNENLKTVIGDKIPTVFTLLSILLIIVIAGVMLRALGVF